MIIDISSDSEDGGEETVSKSALTVNEDTASKKDGDIIHVVDEENENTNTVTNNDCRMVKQYMEITGAYSKEKALEQLVMYNYDLNRAISAYFEVSTGSREVSKNERGDDGTKEKGTHTSSTLHINQNDHSSSSSIAPEQLVIKYHENSKKWSETIAKCKELNVQFIDESFPPNTSSIDGRKIYHLSKQGEQQKKVSKYINKDASSVLPITCHCGLIASIKTVQKDGPNYGRFFLSCGRKRPRMKKHTAKKRNLDHEEGKNKEENNNEIILIDIEDPKERNHKQKQSPQKCTKSDSNEQSKCSFFQWDDQHKQTNQATPRSAWVNQLTWIRYEHKPGYSLTYPKGHYSPEHIRQGILGDCWFLSALAVVAEKPYLIQRLIPHFDYNDTGCYEVFFCLDGAWSSVLVDSLLPSVPSKRRKKVKESATSYFILNHKTEETKGKQEITSVMATHVDEMQPAFASGHVSWPAIVEKAYAKVHGSYARLSGGYISEAFYDLTGSPIERIRFHQEYDYDELFARLLSFSTSGFLMGIATNRGGDGLVACHAYSLLGVYEINNVIVGSQEKLTTSFSKKKCKVDSEVLDAANPKISEPMLNSQPKTVRLVCIRNPWGVREWKGKWSANSEMWTRKIRKQLGKETDLKQGNGTFFMSYEDMIQRFDHLDVAKCIEVSEVLVFSSKVCIICGILCNDY